MPTLNKLDYLDETKHQIKTALNQFGSQIQDSDTFRSYVSKIGDIYNNWPRVTGEGTEITINNSKKGKMELSLSPSELKHKEILPEEYTPVDYISFYKNGSVAYIDLGIKGTQDTKIEIKYKRTTSDITGIFGSFSSSSSPNNLTLYLGASCRFDSEVISNSNSIQEGIVIQDKTGVNNNGTIFPYSNVNNFETDYNLTLGNINNSFQNWSNWYCYYCKIYENNVLMLHLIPCYRNSDNEVGLYDLVNDTFYTKSGTGSLSYGNIVSPPNPDYPQDIHVITGDNEIKIGYHILSYKENAYLDNSGNEVAFNGTNYTTNFIEVLPQTEYVFTGILSNEDGLYVGIYYFDENKNLISRNTDNRTGQITLNFTTPQDCEYIDFQYRTAIGNDINNWTLRKSTSTTNKKIFDLASYSLTLDNLEYCKIGNYKDEFVYNTTDTSLELNKWYLKKNIGKIIFDGSETWGYSGSLASFYNDDLLNLAEVNSEYLCNYFKKVSNSTSFSNLNSGETKYNSTSSVRIFFKYSNYTNADDFKSWLSSHNTIVYYILATPTYILLNDTLQTQLDNIYKWSKSYQDQTNISQTNHDLPIVISASALMKGSE